MGGSPPPKSRPGGPQGDESDRPTLVPDFDPEDFARDSEVRRANLEGDGEPTIDQARRLHADGEHERALFLLTRLLELAPLHPEATSLSGECRAALERQGSAAIGSAPATLVPAVTHEELKGFALDNVSAFLFSLFDGATSVENVLDISGLPRLLALRHLRNLLERGIIGVASGLGRRPAVEPSSSRRGKEERVLDDDSSTVEAGVLPPQRPGTPTLDAVPVLLVAPADIDALDLDPRARTLVAFVNDEMTVEEILTVTRTDLAYGAVVFGQLAEDGIVTFV
jgi:hypothetical protein